MQATVQLPKAFSVRDEHEFLAFQHLLARMNAKFTVSNVAQGLHVAGGGTVFWGLVYEKDKPPEKKAIEVALREAGFDFAHNAPIQLSDLPTRLKEPKT